MSELEFTEEEQSYIDLESGKQPEPVKDEPVEAPEPEQEISEPEEPVVEAEVEAETEEDQEEEEKPKEEPNPPRRTKEDTIRALRADRRELREQTRLQAETQRKLQERLDLIASKLEEPSQPVPDPDMDPDAHREFQDQRIKELEAKDQKAREEAAKAVEQDSELMELQAFVASQEEEFIEEHQDYDEAITWGKEEYAKRLVDQFGISKADAEARVFEQIRTTANQIKEMRGSVPHYLYQQAKAMGFGNGKSAETEIKEVKQSDDLKAISKGQKTAQNPRGGNSGKKGLQLQDLVAMDDEEFNKIASDHKVLKKLFGG